MNYSASIVTITFNDIKNLKKTIESVIAYKNRLNIEYVVVDGGSTDGTLEYLNSIKNDIDVLVSEKDNGIGDAWNKGIKLCSSNNINLLNSGDVHLPGLVENSIQCLINRTKTITYGNTVREVNGEITGFRNGCMDNISIYSGFGFYHPTCFFTKDIIEDIGYFNKNITIAVDTEWLIRALNHKVSFVKVKGITIMDASGISSLNVREANEQYLEVLTKYGYSKFKIIITRVKFYIGRLKIYVEHIFK
jgi:glycosyltransferase involved in cell wall biosynthesis